MPLQPYQWAVKNAASIKGQPQNIAVVGESAGGNLAAAAVAMMARDQHVQLPVHEVLVYPIAAHHFNIPSYQENANAKPLNKAMMQWFLNNIYRARKRRKAQWFLL
ncbi:MAG: esterase [Verrucomicrobiales bacterium]|nr:esterase [Verrucomicrobiales bacterium]